MDTCPGHASFQARACERSWCRLSSVDDVLPNCNSALRLQAANGRGPRSPPTESRTQMTPRFSRAVDGVFVYVIDLLSRIEIDESINHAEEKTQIQSLIDWAEGAVGSCEGWILAKFALVAWIDEVLTQAPWKAREWWDARRLE